MKKHEIHDVFEYRDGGLYWRIKPSQNVAVGSKAGHVAKKGYRIIFYKRKPYCEHVLIFTMFYGYRPEQVDHMDGNILNNDITNLRAATRCQNQYNAKLNKRSASGVKNVSWHIPSNKWAVRVSYQKKRLNLGVFDSLELAELVAIEARNKYHGVYARHL